MRLGFRLLISVAGMAFGLLLAGIGFSYLALGESLVSILPIVCGFSLFSLSLRESFRARDELGWWT